MITRDPVVLFLCHGQQMRPVIAVTYNLSHASQKNFVEGSEADFVRQCQSVKRWCYAEALSLLERLDADVGGIDVLAVQEATDPDLWKRLSERLPRLNAHREFRVPALGFQEGALLLWNANLLGAMEHVEEFNLKEGDARPCIVVTTTKGVTLIVAHFPYLQTRREKKRLESLIGSKVKDNRNIIMLVDSNDANTIIHSRSPFVVAGRKLSQNRTRSELRETMRTCCWHESGHKYGHYTDTGDYVLAETVTDHRAPIPPPTNDPTETELYSDHLPVVATVHLHPTRTKRPNGASPRLRSRRRSRPSSSTRAKR